MIEPSATPDVPSANRHTKLKRRLLKMAAGVVVLYLAAMAAFAYAMRLPPETFSRVMMHVGPIPFLLFPFESMWKNARQGHVHVGDAAPDFTLPLLDHSSQVTLSSFRGTRPVVLVFGSYTWPPFRREVPALNKLYARYKDQVAFYVVYIAEAHPTDIWQMQSNVKEGVLFRNPKTNLEREQVANSCVRKLHIAFPALIDSVDNHVEKAYTGWPDRLFLVGADGKLRFKSEAGPFGFVPKNLEAALAQTRGETSLSQRF
jgi:hypothetical protein